MKTNVRFSRIIAKTIDTDCGGADTPNTVSLYIFGIFVFLLCVQDSRLAFTFSGKRRQVSEPNVSECVD